MRIIFIFLVATTTTTITTTATTNATVAGVGKEEVAIITSPELAKSPSIESVLEGMYVCTYSSEYVS